MQKTSLFVAGILAITAIWIAASEPAALELDELTADYLEDENSGRVLAEIRAKLTPSRLSLAISAQGARVDPIPGFQGVAGSNHITARELESLVSGDDLSVVTRQDGKQLVGSYRPVRWARIPERRFEGGRLIVDAKTRGARLVELVVEAPLFATGEQSIYLVVGLAPRLRIEVAIERVDGRLRGRILDIVSLSAHPVRTRQ